MRTRLAIAALAVSAILALSSGVFAQQDEPTVIATISRQGSRAIGVGVDPVANRIYVGWLDSTNTPSIAVINSATNQEIANIPLPEAGADFFHQIEVNSRTGKIYAVDALSNILYIVNPQTKTFVKGPQQVNTGEATAVDESTNLVYWTNGGVSIVDGTTGSRIDTIFEDTDNIFDVELNTVTHRLYATHTGANKVFVVDVNDNSVLTSVDVQEALWAAVNPMTNRIYVTSYLHPQVTVIDGATSQVIAIMPTGQATNPLNTPHIAVNPATNLLYIANYESKTVDVVDGSTNQVIDTVAVGLHPLTVSVNEATGRVYVLQPAFTPGEPSMVSVIANAPPLPNTGGRPDATTSSGSLAAIIAGVLLIAGATITAAKMRRSSRHAHA